MPLFAIATDEELEHFRRPLKKVSKEVNDKDGKESEVPPGQVVLEDTRECKKLRRDKITFEQRTRFIIMVNNKQLVISNRRNKGELIMELQKLKFPTEKQIAKVTLANREVSGMPEPDDSDEEADGEEGEAEKKGGYNYLLGMPLWNLTHEKVEEMKKQVQEKTAEFEELLGTSAEQMWRQDLEALDAVLADAEEARMASAAKNAKNVEASKARADREKGKPVKRGRGPGKKKGADADADAVEDEEFEVEEAAAPAAGKSKAKDKAGTGGRRPVLMPLDLRTQKTLQAVARECAMEDAEEAVQAEAPVVVKEEEPVGLLARLLKARGEEDLKALDAVLADGEEARMAKNMKNVEASKARRGRPLKLLVHKKRLVLGLYVWHTDTLEPLAAAAHVDPAMPENPHHLEVQWMGQWFATWQRGISACLNIWSLDGELDTVLSSEHVVVQLDVVRVTWQDVRELGHFLLAGLDEASLIRIWDSASFTLFCSFNAGCVKPFDLIITQDFLATVNDNVSGTPARSNRERQLAEARGEDLAEYEARCAGEVSNYRYLSCAGPLCRKTKTGRVSEDYNSMAAKLGGRHDAVSLNADGGMVVSGGQYVKCSRHCHTIEDMGGILSIETLGKKRWSYVDDVAKTPGETLIWTQGLAYVEMDLAGNGMLRQGTVTEWPLMPMWSGLDGLTFDPSGRQGDTMWLMREDKYVVCDRGCSRLLREGVVGRALPELSEFCSRAAGTRAVIGVDTEGKTATFRMAFEGGYSFVVGQTFEDRMENGVGACLVQGNARCSHTAPEANKERAAALEAQAAALNEKAAALEAQEQLVAEKRAALLAEEADLAAAKAALSEEATKALVPSAPFRDSICPICFEATGFRGRSGALVECGECGVRMHVECALGLSVADALKKCPSCRCAMDLVGRNLPTRLPEPTVEDEVPVPVPIPVPLPTPVIRQVYVEVPQDPVELVRDVPVPATLPPINYDLPNYGGFDRGFGMMGGGAIGHFGLPGNVFGAPAPAYTFPAPAAPAPLLGWVCPNCGGGVGRPGTTCGC